MPFYLPNYWTIMAAGNDLKSDQRMYLCKSLNVTHILDLYIRLNIS